MRYLLKVLGTLTSLGVTCDTKRKRGKKSKTRLKKKVMEYRVIIYMQLIVCVILWTHLPHSVLFSPLHDECFSLTLLQLLLVMMVIVPGATVHTPVT